MFNKLISDNDWNSIDGHHLVFVCVPFGTLPYNKQMNIMMYNQAINIHTF